MPTAIAAHVRSVLSVIMVALPWVAVALTYTGSRPREIGRGDDRIEIQTERIGMYQLRSASLVWVVAVVSWTAVFAGLWPAIASIFLLHWATVWRREANVRMRHAYWPYYPVAPRSYSAWVPVWGIKLALWNILARVRDNLFDPPSDTAQYRLSQDPLAQEAHRVAHQLIGTMERNGLGGLVADEDLSPISTGEDGSVAFALYVKTPDGHVPDERVVEEMVGRRLEVPPTINRCALIDPKVHRAINWAILLVVAALVTEHRWEVLTSPYLAAAAVVAIAAGQWASAAIQSSQMKRRRFPHAYTVRVAPITAVLMGTPTVTHFHLVLTPRTT